jgi:excinuclease ABC subunit A
MPPHAAPAERRSELLKSGFLRVFHDDAEWSLEHAETEAMLKAGCALVVDRVKPETASRSRLAEALQTAYATSGGVAHYRLRSGGVHPLTERPTCPDHGPVGPSELTPRHFSFNSWVGACKTCDGLGRVTGIDPDLLLPKPHLTLWKALDPRVASVIKRSKKQKGRITSVLRSMGLKLADRVNTWTDEQRQTVLYGLDQELTARWTKKWGATRNRVVETFSWEGLIPVIDQWNAELTWLRRDQQCPTCKGLKLQRELLAVTVQGTAITEYVANTVESARSFWDTLELSDGDAQVAEQPLREVRNRLKFLSDVGLGYLTLERAARTLSGGESQRIRLATQLGSGLTGCIYVLDEPTVGLHPRDTQRLLNTLEGLRALGNTVLVVEHDEETMRRADRILDMGPGAGEAGGHLVAEGTPAEIEANPDSLTGAYLSRRKRISRPATVREATKWIELTGAHANNLQDVDARFGIGTLTVVTGVSGSGKSSLVMGCLVPALNAYRSTKAPPAPVAKAKIPGVIKGVTVVNQAPLSGSPRSTPATVCKIMDGLRKLYAASHQAKIRGWAPGRFSYNAAGGRCSHCEGRGHVLVEMHFLSDVWVTCESCRGRRYNDETLEVRWRGATIADVLEMRVSEALEFFSAHRSLRRPLQALHDVGLGYLRLGQSVTTLSGGEAQRVKLARQLAGKAEGQVVVLDEPTTGLHPDDVAKLVTVLQRMADAGATLVVIEHHTDVMHNADQILDMGPEGGAEGGMLVASGTVAHVMTLDTPTARALRDHA